MSHYSVLVLTDERPFEKSPEEQGNELDKMLAPFHEFECTGTDDEFVVGVDQTEKVREDYRRLLAEDSKYVKTEDGSRVKTFAEWIGGWNGMHTILAGETPDLKGQHKYGYCVLNLDGSLLKAVRRTNPNARWDWWVVGGLWSGELLTKSGTTDTTKGRPGFLGTQSDPNGVDVCRIEDLDLHGMRERHVRLRRECIERAVEKCNEIRTQPPRDEEGGGTVTAMAPLTRAQVLEIWEACARQLPQETENWEAVNKCLPEDKKINRWDFFHANLPSDHPILVAVREKVSNVMTGWFSAGVPEECTDVEAWINSAPAISSWAVLIRDKDGKPSWHEKGKMGWFGTSTNKMTSEQWAQEVSSLVASRPAGSWVTVVDCHI